MRCALPKLFRMARRSGIFFARIVACVQPKKVKVFMKEREKTMNEVAGLPPDWCAALGYLRLARAVRAAVAEGKPNGKFSRASSGGVDKRRNGVNVENSGAQKTSCVTSMKRSGERSR